MSMMFDTHASPFQIWRLSRRSRAAAALKGWWLAYITWRIERAAIAQLSAMSDRDLKDIGVHRSDIHRAVRLRPTRSFSRYY